MQSTLFNIIYCNVACKEKGKEVSAFLLDCRGGSGEKGDNIVSSSVILCSSKGIWLVTARFTPVKWRCLLRVDRRSQGRKRRGGHEDPKGQSTTSSILQSPD